MARNETRRVSETASRRLPTRGEAVIFWSKVQVHRCLRGLQNLRSPIDQLACDASIILPTVISESTTQLWREENLSERTLERGKVQNLRIAAKALNGVVIPGGGVFSFWKVLGRCTRAKGYVRGRQLQEGCLVPAIGGGLCQLSNALFDAVLKAGFDIVERHPHTRIIPGSAAEVDRDATVAWNHIDLRFRPQRTVRLEVALTAETLVIRFYGEQKLIALSQQARPARISFQTSINSCVTCGETECHRNITAVSLARAGKKAVLVDQSWPEFAQYVLENAGCEDLICLPAQRERYQWPVKGFGQVNTEQAWTVLRGLRSRKLAQQGPARRRFELDAADQLAHKFTRRLDVDVEEMIVDIKLLPALFESGVLGGRRYSVLMTRWPMKAIHDQLDKGAALNPERSLLSDFRADQKLVECEWAALAQADLVVTPHQWIADQFKHKARLLDWAPAPPLPWHQGEALAFIGPVAARKGAFEFREIVRRLSCPVVVVGSELEGSDFWNGIEVRKGTASDWLNGVRAVVAPALIDDQPRKLLQALASGVPVYASDYCGLHSSMPYTKIDPFDLEKTTTLLRHY